MKLRSAAVGCAWFGALILAAQMDWPVQAQEDVSLLDYSRGGATTGENEFLFDVSGFVKESGFLDPSEYICIWPDETDRVVVMKRGTTKIRYYDDAMIPQAKSCRERWEQGKPDPAPDGCEEFVWVGTKQKSVRLYLCEVEK